MLTDYYKSLGGPVASESDIQLKINYDWGRLTDCLYQEFDDNRTILVSFTTK
ncbi:MAG: hypothetical protein LBR84_06355 [Tannerella sp.]|jgi:hypothetical protein|nr:hypothetical protein [Tannerella sp.]